MSDTPRCDSEVVGFDDETRFHLGRTAWYIPADFARQLERELNDQKAKVRNLTAWLYDIYELGADSMSVGLAVNALNGEQHDETKPIET